MKPYCLFPDVRFLFFTAEGKVFLALASSERERTLFELDSLLDLKKSVVIAHQQSSQNDLLKFLQYYAGHCLNVCKKNKKAAYEKFMQDLFIPELKTGLEVFERLSKLPAYQKSDLFLEGMREALKNSSYSMLHDKDADRYGYAQIFKMLTTMGLLYLDISTNWELGLSYNIMSMLREMIDYSDWTDYPKVNAAIEAGLKELIPCAMWVGLHVVSEESAGIPLSTVISYATLGYSVVRITTGICSTLNQMIGSFSPVDDYFQNYLIHTGASLLFKRFYPLSGWNGVGNVTGSAISLTAPQCTAVSDKGFFTIDDPKKCLNNPEVKAAAADYLNLPVGSTLNELQKHFKKLSKHSYANGVPKNNTVTMAQNLAYECLKMGK